MKDHNNINIKTDALPIKYNEDGVSIDINKLKVGESDNAGYGAEGYIWQKWQPLPNFDGNYPVCGLWIADGKSCGLGIREDRNQITRDTSRFVPHIILD